MPYAIRVENADTFIISLTDALTIDEITELNIKVRDLYCTDEDGSYYIIYDVANLDSFPRDIFALKTASAPISSFSGIKYQLITGITNSAISFLFNMLGQLLSQSLKKVDTVEEALEYVEMYKRMHV